jgi:predicted Zn-ribbon and HTH transcriptional regulator
MIGYVCKCGYALTALQHKNMQGQKCPDCQKHIIEPVVEKK